LKIDKRIAGLAMVSVILSTLIMITIARERIEKPLQILKNDYPAVIEQGRKSTFSFAAVSRKGFEDLQLRFSMLSQKTLKFNEMLDPRKEYNATDDPEDVLNNVVKLSWLKNQTSQLGIGPEKFNQTLFFKGTECKMVIWDYSGVLESLSGKKLVLDIPLIYAAIIDENGEAYYFEGGSTFFFNPQDNIISLSISHNTNETGYLPDDQIRQGTKLPLSQAPKGGVLDYKSVDKDDTFTIIFTIDPEKLPSGFGFAPSPNRLGISVVQVIRAYLDGELLDPPIINLMEGKRRG